MLIMVIDFLSNLSPIMQALLATLFTWLVTALGAGIVFFFNDVDRRLLDSMLGFAAGVMIAASFWSLLAPAIEISENLGVPGWIPAVIGFLMGGIFLRFVDMVLPHLHPALANSEPEGIKTKWQRSVLLVLAVTLHNFPEGLAVGVAFGAAAVNISSASIAGAVALALGIGLQNFPEGAAVSIPLKREGLFSRKSFAYGQMSGVVEPIAGVMGAAGVYYMVVGVSNTGDTLNMNDTLHKAIETPIQYAIPIAQNFDGFTSVAEGEWATSPSSGYMWKLEDDETVSGSTGPEGDNTTGSGNYIAIEASNGGTGDIAYYETPFIDISTLPSSPVLKFYYHMYGSDMGNLYIQEYTNGTWTDLDSIKGEQQTAMSDPWIQKSVSFSSNAIKLRFKAVSAGSYEGDISIDDVFIPAGNDLAIVNIASPTTGIELQNNIDVTIDIYNNGLNEQNNFTVKYSLDSGQTYTSETITSTINSGDTQTHTFATKADLSTTGLYNFSTLVDNTGDALRANDTLKMDLKNYALPYTNYFENEVEDELPEGWNFINKNSSSSYVEVYDGTNSFEGDKSLHFYEYSTSGDLIAVMPPYHGTTLTDKWLEMQVRGEDDSPLIIGVLTDPDDETTFTGVDTIIPPDGSYQKYIISFANYTGSGKYIGLKHGLETTYDDFYIDNLKLYQPPANDIAILNIEPITSVIDDNSGKDVKVTIANFGSDPKTDFPVSYTADGGTNVTTGTYSGTINSLDTAEHTFTQQISLPTGLSTLEAYSELSGDAVNSNDTTSVIVKNWSLPYFTSFEDDAEGDIPDGWSVYNDLSQTSVQTFVEDLSTSVTGIHSFELYNASYTTGSLIGIMPYYGGSLTDKWIDFYVRGDNSDDTLLVGVMTDPTDETTFTVVDTILPPAGSFERTYVSFENYTGSGNYIAFKLVLSNTNINLYIDDLTLEVKPNGPTYETSKDTVNFANIRNVFPDTLKETITITNGSFGDLNISSLSVNSMNTTNFILNDTNTYPKDLAMYESLSFDVKFVGSSSGIKNGKIDIVANSVTEEIVLNGEVNDVLIANFPYKQDFENGGNIPLNWENDQNDGGSEDWSFTTSDGNGPDSDFSGTGYYAMLDDYSIQTSNNPVNLITPPVDLSAISSTITMNYKAFIGESSDPNPIHIDISTDFGENWTEDVYIHDHSTTNSWEQFNLDMTAYANDTVLVRFRGISTYGFGVCNSAIDNVAFGTDFPIDLGPDTLNCSDIITLDAGYDANWSYQWFDMSDNSLIGTNQTLDVDTTGTYAVLVTDNFGFTGTDTINVDTDTKPDLTLNTVSDQCINGGNLTLDFATPTGGTYSGSYISSGEFDPATAGPGTHYAVYTYTDQHKCTAVDSVAIAVNDITEVSISDMAEVCVDAASFALSGATPVGGTYSGTGVDGSGNFDPAIAGVGTHYIKYSYTNSDGCTDIDSATITVNPLPDVTFPAIADVCEDGAVITLDMATPAGGTYSGSGVSGDTFDPAAVGPGTYEIIYAYEDDNGCINMDTSYITVNPLPDITASAETNPVSYGTATEIGASIAGSASYTYAWSPDDSLADPTNYDNETVFTKNLSKPTTFNVVVTNDATGCTNNQDINITITGGPLSATPIADKDNVCKDETNQLFAQASGGSESYTYSWSSNPAGFTSTDANPVVTVHTTTTYTVTVDDGFKTATSSVTVIADPYAPTVITQDDTVYLDNTGQASITALQIDDGSYDDCAVANHELDITSFDCTDIGTNDVVLTVTDDNNNSAQATAQVTVMDTIKPQVVTQDINAYLDASGQVSITPNDVDGGSTDNCTIDSLSIDTAEFDCSSKGANEVILTVVDVNGNSAYDTAIVTVIDTVPPVLSTQSATVYLDASGQVTMQPSDIEDSYSDNCGSITNYTMTPAVLNCYNIGMDNMVTIEATDEAGNSTLDSAEVTVLDTITPTVNTQDITVYLDNSGNVTITPADVDDGSEDNCAIDNISLDMNSFSCADVGTNTVHLTVTDVNGNSATASATVTVEDNIAPVNSVVNIPVFLDASGQATIAAADVNNNTTDNCGIDTMMLSNYDFTCSDKGPNLIDFTAEDVNGNTSTSTVVVTVYDVDAPTVNTKDVTVYLNNMGVATISDTDVDNNSTDNCSIMNMSLNNTMFTCSDIGANTVMLTVTDNSLNSASATAQVTVMDTTAPQVNTNNITVYLDNSGQASITPSDINNGTSDNCNLDQLSLDKQSFDCTDIGNNTVTLTATDVNGNSATEDAIVTVVDNTAPTVNTNAFTAYLDATGQASIAASDLDNGSSDNCSIDTMMLDQYNFNCSDVGSHMVTLTVKDMSNNSASDIAVVTVEDTISPNVVTSDMTIYLDNNGEASISLSDIDNGSTDNCGIDTMQLDQTMFSCADLGANTIHLTVTDVNNNSATQTATVTVEDTIAPVFIPKPDTLVCGAGVFDFTMPDALDNCSPTVTQTAGPSNTDPLAAGMYTFEFVATDDAGNTDTTSFTAIVSDPQADLGPDTTICHNSSIELSVDSGYVDYIWSTGDTTHTITVDTSGLGIGTHDVWVVVTDSLGCTATDTIEITIDDCTGIHEFTSKGEINIYPNPNKGMFNLEIQDIEDSRIEVCIYNFNGQKIVCEQIKQNFKNGFVKSYDLSTQPKGVYLIRLTGNTTQITERIIIQ